MNRQTASVFIVGAFAQSVEQDRVDQADQKSKGTVRIRHDQKQRRPLVAELI